MTTSDAPSELKKINEEESTELNKPKKEELDEPLSKRNLFLIIVGPFIILILFANLIRLLSKVIPLFVSPEYEEAQQMKMTREKYDIFNLLKNVGGIEKVPEPPVEKSKKTIKIKYVDFWEGFKLEDFIFHKIIKERYNVVLSDKPDYIFFSDFGKEHRKYINKHHVRLQYSIGKTVPDFNYADYGIGYSLINFTERFLRYPHYLNYKKINKLPKERTYIPNKKFCGIILDKSDLKIKQTFYEELSKYKKVEFKKNDTKSKINDEEYLSNYKFSILFENIVSPGYSTEKLFEGFVAGTIPIYFGDISIYKFVNPKSFIHIKNEKDIPEAIKRIKEIDKNDKLYKKMLKEPIFIDEHYLENQEKKMKNFLYFIFDQDKYDAKRIHPTNEN